MQKNEYRYTIKLRNPLTVICYYYNATNINGIEGSKHFVKKKL